MEKEQVAEIRKLYSEGSKIIDLSRKYKVSTTTIRYYVNEDYKKYVLQQNVQWFKKLPIERRRFYYKKRLAYQTKYQRDHYQNDEVFRAKQKARARKKKE
jgi:hypothetical protein